MMQSIGSEKVELTIFCNNDPVYAFLINYVMWHYSGVVFRGNNFNVEELMILIKASKRTGNYSQALRICS
jgi:hypothetical protein